MAKQILMSSPFGQSLLDFDVVTSKNIPKGILYTVDPSFPQRFITTQQQATFAQEHLNRTMAKMTYQLSDAYIYGRATPPVRRPWSKTISWIARDRVMELIHPPGFVDLSSCAQQAASSAYQGPILEIDAWRPDHRNWWSMPEGEFTPLPHSDRLHRLRYEWVEGVGYRRIGRNPHPWR